MAEKPIYYSYCSSVYVCWWCIYKYCRHIMFEFCLFLMNLRSSVLQQNTIFYYV